MKPSILLVEDDLSLLEILKRFLEDTESDILTATSLFQAKIMMDKIPPPDFIFLDLTLEDSSANNTLQSIEFFRVKNPLVVIVILTGNPDEKLQQIARSMGADSFMHKNSMRSQIDLWRTIEKTLKSRIASGIPIFQASSELLSTVNNLILTNK